MPLSASIFRRGGPKKERFDIINEDVDDEKALDEKLAELDELLHSDKIGRELSAALWRPSICAAELLKQRKQCARDMGFIRGHRTYLHVEEAVYLVDRGDLLLFVEEPDHPQQQQQPEQVLAFVAGGADLEGNGSSGLKVTKDEGAPGDTSRGWRRRQQRQRLLSIQEAFDLMMSVGVSMERYLLYSSLNRSGYLVMRHPSRWLLGREEQPDQVWGGGAWAACYGLSPSVPGAVPQYPMQQQLAAACAADAAAVANATPHGDPVGHPAATVRSTSQMDVDSRVMASATRVLASRQPSIRQQQQQRRRHASGTDQATEIAAETVTAAVRCRGWWRVADPGHPHLQGVPEDFFRYLPPAVVTDRLVTSLRVSFPKLQPLPTIQSVLEAPVQGLPLPGKTPPLTGDAVAIPAHDTSGAVDIVTKAAGPVTDPAIAAVVRGISLGTPGASAHLVFDVYKPGSCVSRYKGQFPVVHTHVVMCSDAPPTLGEMKAADAAAAAAVTVLQGAAVGPAARPASVTWAAVLNGDIALFSMGEADLLSLV